MTRQPPTQLQEGVRPAGSDTKYALAKLSPLWAPESVAIVGASSTPGKYGHTVVRYLQNAGFKGRIYPINPEGGVHEGLQFYKSLLEVPERIDCAYSIVPAAATVRIAADAAKAGVRALIIGASGFAEMATDGGRQRQAAVLQSASEAGMIILGPNTNGIWNAHHGLALGFNTSHGEPMVKGPLSVAAHSGALFDSFLPRLKQFGGGFSKLVPLGNEANLDMLEVLEAFIEDPETQVIGLVMEAVRDGARLRELSRRAHAAGKPIIALKLGRSTAGATAAVAHATRLAGSFRAYEALLDACGIPIVRSIETLAGICTLASDKRALCLEGDTRLIGVSGSGGGCSLMADHAAERGIALAGDGAGAWTGETAKVIEGLEDVGLVRNPIDGGNLHGWGKLPDLIAAMERDGFNGPLAGFAHRLPTLAGDQSMQTPIITRKQRTGAPAVLMSPGGLRPEISARYAAEGIPVFSDLAACFDSLSALYELNAYGKAWREQMEAQVSAPPASFSSAVRHELTSCRGDFLTEIESGKVLASAGIKVVDSVVVSSVAQAQAAADAMSNLVVMKAIVPGVAHKNDAGHVIVGVSHENAIAEAFETLVSRAGPLGTTPDTSRIVVQRYVAGRAEVIVGTTHEPGLGHFLLAGLGGIHAELLDSVVLIPIPTPPAAITAKLAPTKLGQLLAKLSRHQPHDFLAEVVAALESLQRIVLGTPDLIRSIDVNPLTIGPTGAIALDGLIVLAREA